MELSSKKLSAIIAILVILLVILAGIGLVYFDELTGFNRVIKIELQESSVPAGVPSELHFTTNAEKTTVIFPDNIMVAHEGILRNRTTYEFKSSEAAIQILVPPTVTSFEILVKADGIEGSFDISTMSTGIPLISGDSFFDHESTITRRFNNRNAGTIQLRRAAEYYVNHFASLGYDSEIREYQEQDGLRTLDILDVIAYKWGTEHPDEWVVIGGHYDIVQRSIEGAYDNGAGSAAVLELADGFSELTTSRTMVFGLWDGEEKGLWGSNFFAKDIPSSVNVKAYLNFDMVGLNWPLPYDLLCLIGPNDDPDNIDCPDLNNIAHDAVTKYLGYPLSGIQIRESSGGGSDHLSFQRIGVQTYFFYGDSPYIQYHRRTDLLADMVAYAGGRGQLEEGFATVAWVSFYIAILIDNNDTLQQMPVEE